MANMNRIQSQMANLKTNSQAAEVQLNIQLNAAPSNPPLAQRMTEHDLTIRLDYLKDLIHNAHWEVALLRSSSNPFSKLCEYHNTAKAMEKERRRLRDSIQDALREAEPLVEYWLAKLNKRGIQDKMYNRATNLKIAYNTVVAAYDSALRECEIRY